MQTFAILMGLPGSGKSTAARKLKAERGFFVVSSDSLRLALNAGVYPREADGEYKFLDRFVWELAQLGIRRLLDAGRKVAIDATNLTREKRAEWRKFAREVRPDVRVEIHWCVGRWDSPKRWATERGHTEAEYLAIRSKLEAAIEEPREDEADAIVVHDPGHADA
jgi:predicted kinase